MDNNLLATILRFYSSVRYCINCDVQKLYARIVITDCRYIHSCIHSCMYVNVYTDVYV